jgi:hypothetical protein
MVTWTLKARRGRRPRHAAMKPFIAAVREQRRCVDYED